MLNSISRVVRSGLRKLVETVVKVNKPETSWAVFVVEDSGHTCMDVLVLSLPVQKINPSSNNLEKEPNKDVGRLQLNPIGVVRCFRINAYDNNMVSFVRCGFLFYVYVYKRFGYITRERG